MARKPFERYLAPTYEEVRKELESHKKEMQNKIINYSHFDGGPWIAIVSEQLQEAELE